MSVTKGQGRADENVLYDGELKIRRIEVTLCRKHTTKLPCTCTTYIMCQQYYLISEQKHLES